MTEFKVGDRVSASFEGEVTHAGADLVDIKTEGRVETVFKKSLTLLERPVEPLAPGSVVRYRSTGLLLIVQGDGRTYCVDRTHEWRGGESGESLARLTRDHPNDYTLIYDGGKK